LHAEENRTSDGVVLVRKQSFHTTHFPWTASGKPAAVPRLLFTTASAATHPELLKTRDIYPTRFPFAEKQALLIKNKIT